MKIGLLVALQCVASAFAYKIVEGSISTNTDKIEIGEFNVQVVRPLEVGPKDKIEIVLKIDELTRKPHQSLITIGNGQGLEYTLSPVVSVSSNTVKLSIPSIQFPPSIKSQDNLFIKLILADKGNQEANLYQSIAELAPNADLRATIPSSYKTASRVGIKPEIHHIFREDPTSVNPVIPLVFIVGAVTLFLGFLATWALSVGGDLFKHFSDISGIQIIYDVAFLGCLVGYEITFAKYYLGSSIFSTLFSASILGGPSIYFGARVFRDLAKFRKIGK